VSDEEKAVIEKYFPYLEDNTFLQRAIYEEILPATLDAAKEENIRPLYKMAKEFDGSLQKRDIVASLFPPEKPVLDGKRTKEVFG
jgi:hypothetical protein